MNDPGTCVPGIGMAGQHAEGRLVAILTPFPTHWLVTINTYGSWLPGDPRGFRTKRGREYVPPPARFARRGEKTYDPEEYRRLHELSQSLSGGRAFEFPPAMRPRVLKVLVERIDRMGIGPRILSTGRYHCHLVARFGRWRIRRAMGQAKAAVTGEFRRAGDQRDIWAAGCSMRSKETPEAVRAAIEYVRSHVREGAVIYEWPDGSP